MFRVWFSPLKHLRGLAPLRPLLRGLAPLKPLQRGFRFRVGVSPHQTPPGLGLARLKPLLRGFRVRHSPPQTPPKRVLG